MSLVHVVAHQERSEVDGLVRRLETWAHARDSSVQMDLDDAAALGRSDLASERPPAAADLVVSLGGDGTTLRAVRSLAGAEPEHLEAALDAWRSGERAIIDERMMLDIDVVHADGAAEHSLALNEVVIEKQLPGHTVRMLVHIDGEVFTSYAADGLIVSTPTGSTAYALSARGPVVSPRHRAVLLTPVSPHMLFDRSLVLSPDEDVTIELTGHRTATVTVDGRPMTTVAEGDRIRVTASAHVARFVRFEPRRFHQILKAKFGLADR
jgi:NAD+ kinase